MIRPNLTFFAVFIKRWLSKCHECNCDPNLWNGQFHWKPVQKCCKTARNIANCIYIIMGCCNRLERWPRGRLAQYFTMAKSVLWAIKHSFHACHNFKWLLGDQLLVKNNSKKCLRKCKPFYMKTLYFVIYYIFGMDFIYKILRNISHNIRGIITLRKNLDKLYILCFNRNARNVINVDNCTQNY